MREFKFRAWDTESSRMVYDPYFFDVYHFSDENRVNQKTYRYYEDWRALEDGRGWECELMQYVGLKDKNGKEIYEGDIVMFLDRDWMDFERDTKRLPVVYENDAFVLKDIKPDRFGEYGNYALFKDYGRDRFEVIGNIYQDKHLLK